MAASRCTAAKPSAASASPSPNSAQIPRACLRARCAEVGGYVLNGEKMWITNGSLADVAAGLGQGRRRRVRGFLVEKGTPGFKSWDVHGKLSLRASITSGLSFTDCEVPADNLLARGRRPARTARLPHAGALRHRLGRHRRGHGLLSDRPRLRQDAPPVRKQAHRRAPARAGQAGLDDHRNQQGATAGPARRPPQGRRSRRRPRTSPCSR